MAGGVDDHGDGEDGGGGYRAVSTAGRFGLVWGARTYLRFFLVAAGGALLLNGVRTGAQLDVALGVLAVAVGVIGLAIERRD